MRRGAEEIYLWAHSQEKFVDQVITKNGAEIVF
jgi:hypothetical protein